MLASRRRFRSTIDVWPGYVDALSALLMLVIFALLIFTLAQVFLAETLSEREHELSDLNSRLRELSSLLDLEQEKNLQLDEQVKSISDEYSQSLDKQYELFGEVDRLNKSVAADRETIELQLRTLASLQQDIAALRELRTQLEQQVGRLAASLEGREAEVGLLRDRSKSLQAQLADEQERTLLAQQAVTQKDIRIEELFVAVEAGRAALEQEQELSTSARAQVDLLNRQIAALREQLGAISQALKLAEEKSQGQELEISNLGKRLNLLLAKQVNELEKYRSEFFGTLRKVLGQNPNIRVVGDRFVFPSELLFDSGSATLGQEGRGELAKLAVTLDGIAAKIPPEVSWILRVDGHTDRQPINTERFPSNWELSTARAVSVVRYLASQGIPAKRLAATGFAQYHPVDSSETAEAFQRNRRIEIKLTDR
ncbi:MAG: peptidoglycan -binding protein [Chromatiaceae bacterium]|nr:peptidoglycan -binding protein [Gammaproteobacteria bacterium]MCB1872464.1 peptidoglycan -binding protein [Gammaproteobacteria bacterium]MCP5445388.1 peptidoglycan -binding protein [Chromatiaceae bacterium]